MKQLVLTPFTERGYEKLSNLLIHTGLRVFLPIPRDICRDALLLNNIPSGYVRIWRPVLDLVYGGLIDAECYLSMNDLSNAVDRSIKITSLVLKARIFNKINVNEWISISPRDLKPRFRDWNGLLVLDRFIEYVLLVKNRVPYEGIILLDYFIPTPLDLFILVVNNLIEWKCDLYDVIKWIIKYIGEIVVLSKDLTDAYVTLIESREYRDLIHDCSREIDLYRDLGIDYMT